MTAHDYVQSVIDYVPRGLALRDSIAMELSSHLANGRRVGSRSMRCCGSSATR